MFTVVEPGGNSTYPPENQNAMMAKAFCSWKRFVCAETCLRKKCLFVHNLLRQVALLLFRHSAKSYNAQDERLATSP